MNKNEIVEIVTKRLAVPAAEALLLADFSNLKNFGSDDYIFTQGQKQENIYFILSGLAYLVYLNLEGQEKIKRFVFKGDALAPYISILTGELSTYSARTLKPCVCLEISYSKYMKLVTNSWHLESAHRKELEFHIVEREKKEYELFMLSAKERYESFSKRYSEYLEDIPLKYIASYINVDPATLSRIRAKK